MSEPFIAEIRIFAGDFAPRGWAFCDGQLLPIANNTALFSLIGTVYGGDGRNTTALPNMKGRAPMEQGRGPGLTARRLGEELGSSTVTLNESQIPSHNHPVRANLSPGDEAVPSNATSLSATGGRGDALYSAGTSNLVPLADETLQASGGNQAHDNMQPYLALNFIIALQGIYPSRG